MLVCSSLTSTSSCTAITVEQWQPYLQNCKWFALCVIENPDLVVPPCSCKYPLILPYCQIRYTLLLDFHGVLQLKGPFSRMQPKAMHLIVSSSTKTPCMYPQQYTSAGCSGPELCCLLGCSTVCARKRHHLAVSQSIVYKMAETWVFLKLQLAQQCKSPVCCDIALKVCNEQPTAVMTQMPSQVRER